MLATLFSSPLYFAIWALALVVAISIHEWAHAYSADRLGDPTPRADGRLTLNPRAHLDPLGTLTLLLIGFGWGKPVIFDPYNLRNPRRDAAIISLAGPVSNLVLASLLAIVLRIIPPSLLGTALLTTIIQLNIGLAIFNLVPVYPLDGEKILAGILSPQLAREYSLIMRQYGTLILIFLLLPMGGSSPIGSLITPVISFVTNVLL